ncbi:hypothetical protein Val02_92020 [Virgisporangium aliadipatigenens]|uniref:Cytokinin riboside 5'-monophosphate phosphoribohydrolase n=1 Tax=Virgisporangium aliadipatigenens TaxID=741659 RepID=A0A8J4DWA7_9ACTN|nr:TIGR00730 family Rossman fold protein [Virgisporangium aliadipatigenens]GIJ52316.1 hypothetical protein Val02_92020 [Virgisporangium aliadipatigenens]
MTGVAEEGRVAAELERTFSRLNETAEAIRWRTGYLHSPIVSVFGSARTAQDDPAYWEARRLGALIAERGWTAMTGGGPGIMQAVADGAGPDSSLAVRIELPGEAPERPLPPERTIVMGTFWSRKILMSHDIGGAVFLPGGIGTLDELFDYLVLRETGRLRRCPLVLLEPPGTGFWTAWRQFVGQELVDNRFVDRDLLTHVDIVNSAEGAVEILAKSLDQ